MACVVGFIRDFLKFDFGFARRSELREALQMRSFFARLQPRQFPCRELSDTGLQVGIRTMLATLIIWVVTAMPAHPQGYVRGAGTKNCVEWTRFREYVDANPVRVQYESWVLGYLSGVSVTEGNPDFLANVEPNEIFAKIDLRCSLNSSEQIVFVANDIAKTWLKDHARDKFAITRR
jgi:hypothetical protein